MAKDFTRRCAWMCFLGYVAMFTIGAVDAKTNFTAVKKTPSPKEWQVFYKACPGFNATDGACLGLKRLAVEKGLNLKKAYQSYYTGEELRLRNEAEKEREEARGTLGFDWATWYAIHPEFEATDCNCVRLEDKTKEERR